MRIIILEDTFIHRETYIEKKTTIFEKLKKLGKLFVIIPLGR